MSNDLKIIFSGLIGVLLSLAYTQFNNKKTLRKDLKKTLMDLNEKILKEPFLENDFHLSKYLNLAESLREKQELSDKYNIFCIMKFNYLENLCEFHKYNLEELKKDYGIIEYIKESAIWWKINKKPNSIGYRIEFINFIEKVLNEA